jgi:glycine/D-amino acid oxidase-like deaminating enzyme
MQTQILIIGQGICGTFLSWYLEKAGVSYMVIDETRSFTASKAAAGIINPVTGRRIVKTWMIDELIPFARDAYQRIGAELGIVCMQQKDLVDFFPTPQMRLAFLKRYEEDPQYLQLPGNENDWNEYFRYDFGYGVISPCWLVDLPGLLAARRKQLLDKGALLEERFEQEALIVSGGGVAVKSEIAVKSGTPAEGSNAAHERDHGGDTGNATGGGIRYKDIHAEAVIFCDGIESFASSYFSLLPFAPNKGEALVLEIPGLRDEAKTNAGITNLAANQASNTLFKKGITLAPWKEGLYWVGSSYEWSFAHTEPTEAFRQRTEQALREWLKVPFKTIEHIASVRPATLERRPFVGFHPRYPAIGILNGMGTKGCSLAPYFASQLVDHITKGTPIRADADVKRFSRVLKRG